MYYVWSHVWTLCEQVCVCGSPRLISEIFLDCSSTLFIEAGSTNQTNLASVTGHTLGICPLPPQTGITS